MTDRVMGTTIGDRVMGLQVSGRENDRGTVMEVIPPAPDAKGYGFAIRVEWDDGHEDSWHDASDMYWRGMDEEYDELMSDQAYWAWWSLTDRERAWMEMIEMGLNQEGA